MTTPDIDRIQELEAKATPGPWARAESIHAESSVVVEGFELTRRIAQVHPNSADYGRGNAEFIAAAREAVPFLLAALDERDKRITELECPHDSWSGDRPSSEPNGRWLCDQCGTDCGPRDALPDPRIAELERQIASVREVLRDADQYLVDDNWLGRLLAALGGDL